MTTIVWPDNPHNIVGLYFADWMQVIDCIDVFLSPLDMPESYGQAQACVVSVMSPMNPRKYRYL
jgi:hypothetical protein